MSCTFVGRIWCGIHATTKVHKLFLDNQLKNNISDLSHFLSYGHINVLPVTQVN